MLDVQSEAARSGFGEAKNQLPFTRRLATHAGARQATVTQETGWNWAVTALVAALAVLLAGGAYALGRLRRSHALAQPTA
jgi:anti-sigma-K factor RskA